MDVAYKQQQPIALRPQLRKVLEARAKQLRQPPSELVETAVRRYLSETGTRSAAWKRVRAYARKNAQAIGIRSTQDIQRAIDEYRQGNFAPHAPARRR
jgi:ribosomal protein L13